MLKVKITEEMIQKATEKAERIPPTHNTFMSQERRIIGFIGEQIFEQVFPEAVETTGKEVYDYDYKMYTKKVELKTKMVGVPPQPHHECSIYTYYNQKSDYYFFCSIIKDVIEGTYPHGWLLGYTSVAEFKQKCFLIEKGVPQSNGLIPRINTWNMKLSDLLPMERLMNNIDKLKESK